MPTQEVIQFVDQMVQSGRIPAGMQDQYINDIEAGLGQHLLRGADYTNKTKQLAEERRQAAAQLEVERQQLQAQRRQLEDWQRQVQAELERSSRLQTEVPELAARAAAMEQVLADYDMLDKVSFQTRPNIGANPAPAYQPPTNSSTLKTPDYVTKNDAMGALQNLFQTQEKINRIAAQHFQLFGQPLDDSLMSHYMETGEDPEQHWKVKYGVDARRDTINQQNREAEIAKMKEEIRAQVMQEFSTDPSRLNGSPWMTEQGISPLLAQYTASRALQHSQNDPNRSEVNVNDYIAPELKPKIQSSRDSVDAAVRLFTQNFDANGNAVTDKGRQLNQRYYNPEG